MLLKLTKYPSTSTKAVDLTTVAITPFSNYAGLLSVGVLPIPTCADTGATNYQQPGACTY